MTRSLRPLIDVGWYFVRRLRTNRSAASRRGGRMYSAMPAGFRLFIPASPRIRRLAPWPNCAGASMRRRVIAACIALLVVLPAMPVAGADMSKTLRVAFQTAETGFDPQAVYDLYSFDVCRAIFDPLY